MKNHQFLTLILLLTIVTLIGCQDTTEEVRTPSGLRYEVLKSGKGAKAKEGDRVKVHESMTYLDGTFLLSTKNSDNLPKILIGGGRAIEGVDEGIRGMQVGEICKLIVPPSLSKRKQYPEFLSPDSTLVYEIEMMEIIVPIEKDIVNKEIRTNSGPKSGFEMVFVKGGSFIMGGDDDVDDGGPPEMRMADECPHPMTVNDFYIGKYEVTQSDWMEIMGNNPSKSKDCNDCPVDQVSWEDVQEFILKLNTKYDESFRLPNEEEWEFAARGGLKSQDYLYAGSNQVNEVAWFEDNSNGKSHSVGTLNPNELGIFDMSGNIWEWCSNSKTPYPCDKLGKVFESKVLRGGTFGNRATSVRTKDRNGRSSSLRLPTLGFRLAK